MTSRRDAELAAPREIAFEDGDPAREKRRESLCALGNGVLVSRSCAPEAKADGRHYPGTYRAGCYNRLTSVIEGESVEDESLVNLPNWLPLSFRAAGAAEWFAGRPDEIAESRRALDMRRGIASRELLCRDAQGRVTRLREERLVSMAAPHLMAIRLELTPESWSGEFEIRAALDGDIINCNVARHRAFAHRHLDFVGGEAAGPETLLLQARARQSRIAIAVAARTRTPGAERRGRLARREGKEIAETFRCTARQGEPLVIEKVAAIFTSRDPDIADEREAARAAVEAAPDFAALAAAHDEAWAHLWRRCRIAAAEPELAQAIAFHAFHLLQTVSPHSVGLDVGFPPRGWEEGYRGQIFWDEIFIFPFLDLRFPEIARALLLYRYRRLDAARIAAQRHGYRGAMFPWRSASTGREETPALQLNLLTGTWSRDDTRLQRHIGAAIAWNLWHYVAATGDIQFLADYGAEMLIEIARFWASIARFEPASGRYEIHGVIGPDEYHNAYPGAAMPGLDNNAYTNLMAVWTLCRGLEVLDRLPEARRAELRGKLQIGADELALWDDISRRMRLVFHGDGIISQFEGFERLREVDWHAIAAQHPGERVDWALAAHGQNVDDCQVTKQADVLMLLYLLPGDQLIALAARLGYPLTREQLRRTARYYLDRITHESSLSRGVCAGALAQLDPPASWRFFRDSLHPDAHPPSGSRSEEGLHLGAMAGTIDVLQRHYLGIDLDADDLVVTPSPPAALGRFRMELRHRGSVIVAEYDGTRLSLAAAPENRAAVAVRHAGGRRLLTPGESMSVAAEPATEARCAG